MSRHVLCRMTPLDLTTPKKALARSDSNNNAVNLSPIFTLFMIRNRFLQTVIKRVHP